MRRPHRFQASARSLLDNEDRMRRQPPQTILDRTDLSPGQVWADIGCGVGYFTIPLREAGAKVVAIDAQREMLESLTSRAKDMEGICLVQFDMPPLPLLGSKIDRALMVNVLHEVEDRKLLSSEVSRILRPGGHLIVVDFQKGETPHGPPAWERLSPEEACSIFDDLTLVSRHDEEEYYQLDLRFGRDPS